MIQFSNTIEIRKPVEVVFAYLSDLENTPRWNWAISETRKTSEGPAGVGATYRQVRKVPRPATETLQIVAYERGELFAVEGTLASMPAHVTYRLRPTEFGTEVINTIELSPSGPLRLLAPVAGGRIQRSVADNLRVLKAQLEAMP